MNLVEAGYAWDAEGTFHKPLDFLAFLRKSRAMTDAVEPAARAHGRDRKPAPCNGRTSVLEENGSSLCAADLECRISGGEPEFSRYAAQSQVSTDIQAASATTSGGRAGMYQIGEVAERVGLSLRTVRYYEEVGLLDPVARTQGHFRLFTERDVERLLIIMQMKPTGFTLEEMREQLDIRDRLKEGNLEPQEHAALVDRLAAYADAAVEKAAKLRKNLAYAERLVETLHAELNIERSCQQLGAGNR
jgi:DNA-binding transcriptional MerR regulator